MILVPKEKTKKKDLEKRKVLGYNLQVSAKHRERKKKNSNDRPNGRVESKSSQTLNQLYHITKCVLDMLMLINLHAN